MKRETLAARLTARVAASTTAPPAASSPVVHQNGGKLEEAARYLKSARVCLLSWVRQNYVASDNVDANTEHVRDLLAWERGIEDMECKLSVKASVLGK